MAQFTPEKFLDFVTNFRTDNPKQREAMLEFARQAYQKQPELFKDEAKWVSIYRTKVESSPIMKVPYFSQRDNYTDPSRTCFSSSCAMLLEYMKPGTLPGLKGDDNYLRRVYTIGDTIYPDVQVRALASFGLKTKFVSNGTFSLLDSQLEKKIPVPIGILHHGPSNAPTGGGHWVIVIGKEGSNYVVNDPWGEIDNATGTYISQNGKQLRYSKSLLTSRWTVYGDGSGYAIIA